MFKELFFEAKRTPEGNIIRLLVDGKKVKPADMLDVVLYMNDDNVNTIKVQYANDHGSIDMKKSVTYTRSDKGKKIWRRVSNNPKDRPTLVQGVIKNGFPSIETVGRWS